MKTKCVDGCRAFKKARLLSLIAGVCAAFGVAADARAGDGVWNGNAGDGSWSNAVNWANGVIADGVGATAWFTNNIYGNTLVDLSGTPRTLGTLTVGDSDANASFTLSSTGGAALTLIDPSGKARIHQTTTSTGDLISFPLVFGANVDLVNDATDAFTLSSKTSGTGDLSIMANGTGGITLNPPANQVPSEVEINHVGKIVNKGTGTGTVLIGNMGNVSEGEIGPNVTGVVQESPTSKLVLGYFGWYTGGVTIKAGSVEGRRMQDSAHCNSFGSLANVITIGDIAGSSDATLIGSGWTFPQRIEVASNNTGVASITTGTGAATFSGAVTLNDHDLRLTTTATALTMSGGFSGNGDLLLQADGAAGLLLATRTVDLTGDIVNSGAGSGVVTLSAEIGAKVGEVKQESATSVLVLSGANSYAGPTTVSAGTLRVANIAGSATGTGAVSLQTNAVLSGTGAALGVVTNAPGAILSPGTAAGTRGILTVGDLVWQEDGIFQCDISSLDGGAPGVDYDQLQVGNLTAQPGGGKIVIKLNSLGKTLPVTANENYTLWLVQYGSAPGLDIADIQLDTSAFLVSGGTWFLTNMYNSICYVNRGGGPIDVDPTKNCWVGSGKWSNAGNWSWGHAPLAGEDVAFGDWSTAPCTADQVNNNLASLTLNHRLNKVTFAPNAVSGGMDLTITGDLTVNAGQLIFGGDTSTTLGTGYAIQAANITVAAGASLNADEQGFALEEGPSPASSDNRGAWGASHGGYGGVGQSLYLELPPPAPRYGSASHPTSLGSGGAAFAGGGALKLTANNILTINGTLSASSTNSAARGASGGSIWIAGGTLAGSGRIMANGSVGTSVGGGGGRIDISGAVNNFSGSLEVMFGGYDNKRAGGTGNPANLTSRRGMVGSIMLPQSAGSGLTLDNFAPVRNIFFGNSLNIGSMTLDNVTVDVQAYDDETVITCDTLTIRDAGTLKCWGDTFAINAAAGGTPNRPFGHGVIIAADTATIDAGGSIDADNTGYHSTKYHLYLGPGGFGYYTRDARNVVDLYSSSAHGGQAGGRRARSASFPSVTSRTPMYGKPNGPTSLGSGGSNYPDNLAGQWYTGGGAVKLVVSGILTVNGRVTADATSVGGYNQPSGGSVWITGGATLQGSGRISANGSNASVDCGGGGGGRVDISGIVNNFAGVVQAKGGNKYNASSQQTRGLNGSLVLPASGGTSGAAIEDFVPYGTDFAFGNSTVFGDCVITNGVVLSLDANDGENVFTFRSLTIKAGGEVRCLGNLPTINEAAGGTATSLRGAGPVIVATNLTVEAGGSLNGNGQGYTFSWANSKAATGYPNPTIYPGGIGYGPYDIVGTTVSDPDAAAGFGGLAAKCKGYTYGSITNFGSGALGSGTKEYAGGGSIRLEVPETLLNNGVISCDGAGIGEVSGGSGGSLLIDCGTLVWTGTISARGGSPDVTAEGKFGGGGGRIFVSYATLGALNPIDDSKIIAYGGGADVASKGAAGTVVLMDKTANDGLTLLVENDLLALDTSTQLANDDVGGTPPPLLIERVMIGANGVIGLPVDGTLAVSETFSNLGGFVASLNSTLAIVGSGEARVYGNTVTTNFMVAGTESVPKVVKFEPGKTLTVDGALVMSNATVRSQTNGQAWSLTHKAPGYQSVMLVSARDSDASGGQQIISTKSNGIELVGWGHDLGGNNNWLFSHATMLILR